jgi:hypothetical protein
MIFYRPRQFGVSEKERREKVKAGTCRPGNSAPEMARL